MNLITVIIIAIVIWLVYSLIQSYRNLEKELKEIRAKCIGINNVAVTTTATTATTKKSETMSATNSPPTPTQITQKVTGNKQSVNDVSQEKITTNAKVNTSTPSGAYTSTGDQLYSSDSSSTLYDNDPLSSMRNSLISGLNTVKKYAMI